MKNDNGRIVMFGMGLYSIYEIILSYENQWRYKIVKNYVNSYGNDQYNSLMCFSDKYIALYLPKEERIRGLVWDRT